MDLEYAKKILETLADGINPVTGEVLSKEDSCNQVEVVRTLHIALRHLDTPSKKAKKPNAENAGKPWTAEDDGVLCRMFESGCSAQDMCNHFQRSHGSIAARLVKLGKINFRDKFETKR